MKLLVSVVSGKIKYAVLNIKITSLFIAFAFAQKCAMKISFLNICILNKFLSDSDWAMGMFNLKA